MRLKLFSRMDDLNNVIGIENLEQQLIPSLDQLSQEKNWRLKLQFLENFPMFARQLGEKFFNEKLNRYCLGFLTDKIYSIRESALENYRQLTVIFGEQWAYTNFFPQLFTLCLETNYLHRLTPLFGIQLFVEMISVDCIIQTFVPVLKKLKDDHVPNIRMNVAKSVQRLALVVANRADVGVSVSTPTKSDDLRVKDALKEVLKDLVQDSEFDVAFFAKQAMKEL